MVVGKRKHFCMKLITSCWKCCRQRKWPVGGSQCDQMAILFVKYLDIYNKDNLPNCIWKFAKINSNFCQNTKWNVSHGQSFYNIVPKWGDFVKSGHTGGSQISQTRWSRKEEAKKTNFSVLSRAKDTIKQLQRKLKNELIISRPTQHFAN